MKKYRFWQLDVFTDHAFGGNQLAVFPDGRGLSDEEMQVIAREMNFSETTFVLPPELPAADWKVRIFTPAMEMPMAGHPTVGTTAVLAAQGMVKVAAEGGEVILELGIGAVSVIVEPHKKGELPFVWMTHRAPEYGESRTDREAIARALGLDKSDIREDLPIEIVSTGVPFLFVPLTGLKAIKDARSEAAALGRLFEGRKPANVALLTTQTIDPGTKIHARMYSPHLAGIVEDPATGSMAAPLGAYLAKHGLLGQGPLSRFTIEQGIEMLRPSRIEVEVGHLDDQVVTLRIGGQSVLVGEGDLFW